MKAMFPVSMVSDGMALNITVMSYQDRLDVGLVACREVVPDLWDMMGDIETSLAELSSGI